MEAQDQGTARFGFSQGSLLGLQMTSFSLDPDDDPRHTCLYVDIHCLKIQDIGSRPIFMTLFYPTTS